MNIFILEDDDGRIQIFKNILDSSHNAIYCDNAKDALTILSENKFDVIFLDHDLGGLVYVDSEDPNTGFQVAKNISSDVEKYKNVKIIIHSWNPVGAINMFNVLVEKGMKSYCIPFGSSLFKNIFRGINR